MVEITAFMDARANEGLVQRLEATHKGLGTWFKDWLKKNPQGKHLRGSLVAGMGLYLVAKDSSFLGWLHGLLQVECNLAS